MRALVMRAACSYLANRAAEIVAMHRPWRVALVVIPHLIALAIMVSTETTLTAMAAFLLAWGILNFFWLVLTRRPAFAATVSLLMMTVLVLLSQLKYHVLLMTANFVDLMIVDTDTVTFLFTIFPELRWIVALSALALVPIVVLAWRCDPFRVHRLSAAALALVCLGALTGLEMHSPMAPFEAFYGGNLVSSFARSGVDAISELVTHGLMESAPFAEHRLLPADETCEPAVFSFASRTGRRLVRRRQPEASAEYRACCGLPRSSWVRRRSIDRTDRR